MKKVTGIGGIFIKTKDPQKMKSWYQEHLGLNTDAYGTNFEWRQSENPDKKGFSQWSPMEENHGYMKDYDHDFIMNYRVENLEQILVDLKAAGVTIVKEMEEFEYGKFAQLLDPEGRKVELWEPNDEEYEKLVEGKTC